jgi:hypothetical protein
MAKILTTSDIIKSFESKGWKLISDKYEGSQKKLDAICNQGHQTTITWNNFQRGQGCKICAGNVQFTIDEVKKQFEDQGFLLLEEKYINNNIPMKCKCSCGEITFMPLCTVKKGANCKKCKNKKISIKNSIQKEELEKYCFEKNIKYLNHYLKNGKTEVEYECNCGEKSKALWTNLRRYPYCKKCGTKNKSGSKCYLWNPDRNQVNLNKNIQKRCWNMVRKVLFKFNKTKDNLKADLLGYSVKDLCNHIKSHELFNSNVDYHIDHVFPINSFIKNNIVDLKIINKLTNLRPLHSKINLSKGNNVYLKAFDKWLENTNEMAEKIIWETIKEDFQNSNLHAELINPILGQDKKYYQELCLNYNKKMFIFPDEWIKRKNQIEHRCKVLSGNTENIIKVGARKCQVKIIEKEIIKKFCDEYHVQGGVKINLIGFGLFYNNELIGILSLSKHHRGGDDLVLNRLCYKFNYQVLGGSEKLLKCATEWAISKNIRKITTFSDKRYTSGDVYFKLGFKKEKSYGADYCYFLKTDPSIRLTKQSQMKSISNCPEDMTEFQWAKERGLVRIWDCGKDTWILNF